MVWQHAVWNCNNNNNKKANTIRAELFWRIRKLVSMLPIESRHYPFILYHKFRIIIDQPVNQADIPSTAVIDIPLYEPNVWLIGSNSADKSNNTSVIDLINCIFWQWFLLQWLSFCSRLGVNYIWQCWIVCIFWRSRGYDFPNVANWCCLTAT